MLPITLIYSFVTFVNCYYIQNQIPNKSINTYRLWFETFLNLIIEAKNIHTANEYNAPRSNKENNNNLTEKSQSYKVIAQAINSNRTISSNGNNTKSNNEAAKNQTNSNVASQKPKPTKLKPIKYWKVPDRTYF
ncbi:hypothetical protein CONCODRAFT_2804 [Conidiobolus coronatus NRRL 28638]|uniref:Uncharacterized protein n=1 Tax=Conidiobolus coronatus (strain ATCC 28846 / CBS 209.66 / NRRL 28638) TaxID=796925 RepID=A0A137PGJ8_CONC2|nr:hypothetical protein CONCODRAFT_2804 [Conidiobolus coronatus NRRL 28638]|eukprot:KXN74100.1 hypothetical protein CONCODRAFT_2804 [Conidiobolus coronatus NRRL 28638]